MTRYQSTSAQAKTLFGKGAYQLMKAWWKDPKFGKPHASHRKKQQRKAMRKMGLPTDTSRPYKPQTNGVAERACRHCKEGTTCTLEQSGFTAPFWNAARKCWNVIRNASEVHAKTGKTPYEFRKGERFPYELIPFGCEIIFKPESPRDMDKQPKFSTKAGLQGLMFGYKTEVGGKPSGEIYIIERTDLEKAKTAKALYKGREIAIEQVLVVKETRADGKQYHKFPLATGDWKQPEVSRLDK